MAGAKIPGTAFLFLNSCPAFQDVEQYCFAVLSQFLLSILPHREILTSSLADEMMEFFLKPFSYG